MQSPEKRKSYSGRWIIRAVETGLVIAIVFFAVDALHNAITPDVDAEDVVVVETLGEEIVLQDDVEIVVEVAERETFSARDYFDMGLAHHNSEAYYDAIVDYSRAIEADSAFAVAWLNRGVANEQLNNMDDAIRDYLRWLSRDGVITLAQDELPLGSSTTIDMAEGRVYEIPLTIEQGQRVTINASAVDGEAVDPIMVILDCNGTVQGGDDDIRRSDGSLISMNARIESFHQHGANCRGDYTLLVSHAGGGSFGTVEVSVERDN